MDQLLRTISAKLRENKGADAAWVMQLGGCSAHQINNVLQASTQRKFVDIVRRLPEPFDQIVRAHFKSRIASREGRYVDAFQSWKGAVEIFFLWMSDGNQKEENWYLPILYWLIRELRLSSYQADDAESGGSEADHQATHKQKADDAESGGSEADDQATHKQKVDGLLKKIYSLMVQNRAPHETSPKMGAVGVIVNLFKLYFKMNTIRLCAGLREIFNSPSFPHLAYFPNAHIVQYLFYIGQLDFIDEKFTLYLFYIGQLDFIDEKFTLAEQNLSLAFENCPSTVLENKRRCLYFLIPLRLFLGKYPEEKLMRMYNVEEFIDLVSSIKSGDLALFDKTMHKHRALFIDLRIYVMLERVRVYVFRNLFRKVHKTWARVVETSPKVNTRQGHQVPTVQFQAALKLQNIEMSIDEIECVFANLIFGKLMKGYIAHNRCIVMSKVCAFPDLHETIVATQKAKGEK